MPSLYSFHFFRSNNRLRRLTPIVGTLWLCCCCCCYNNRLRNCSIICQLLDKYIFGAGQVLDSLGSLNNHVIINQGQHNDPKLCITLVCGINKKFTLHSKLSRNNYNFPFRYETIWWIETLTDHNFLDNINLSLKNQFYPHNTSVKF